MVKRKTSKEEVGRKHGFRSGLEETVAQQLDELGVPVIYEQHKIEYVVPARKSRYTPDFLLPNGIFIETKGRFLASDRKKHVQIKQQKPELDIRFVFQNPNAKLYKGARTTYAQWCEKNGFVWAKKTIPTEWIDEDGPGA